MTQKSVFDCIIIGAGPGGLQAAIYLGRYNRNVLLLDRGGGRTWHARHIENFLTQKAISGPEIIRTGLEQARHFNVAVEKGEVVRLAKGAYFEVHTREAAFLARFVIVSTGAQALMLGLSSMLELTRERMQAAQGIQAKIAALVATRVSYAEDNRDFYRIYADSSNAAFPGSINKDLQRLYLRQVETFEHVLWGDQASACPDGRVHHI